MNTRWIIRLGALGLFMLPFLLLSSAPTLACRTKGYVEQESSSTIDGIPFPDTIEGLERKEMQLATCYPEMERFSVLYRSGISRSVGMISIMDRDPSFPVAKFVEAGEDLEFKMSDMRYQLLQQIKKNTNIERPEILFRNVGGKGGIVILAQDDDGTKYKVIHFTLLMPSQAIKVRYSTSELSSAEDKALAFRNAYLSHLKASSMPVFEPFAALP